MIGAEDASHEHNAPQTGVYLPTLLRYRSFQYTCTNSTNQRFMYCRRIRVQNWTSYVISGGLTTHLMAMLWAKRSAQHTANIWPVAEAPTCTPPVLRATLALATSAICH